MKEYFKIKLGTKLKCFVITGNNEFCKVWKRGYCLEVLKVTDDFVTLEVSSDDYCPSGYCTSGTYAYYGEFNIYFAENKTKADMLKEAVLLADKKFLNEYRLTKDAIVIGG